MHCAIINVDSLALTIKILSEAVVCGNVWRSSGLPGPGLNPAAALDEWSSWPRGLLRCAGLQTSTAIWISSILNTITCLHRGENKGVLLS
ncbi:unnamed protein product [Leuciscus chuanchicus]